MSILYIIMFIFCSSPNTVISNVNQRSVQFRFWEQRTIHTDGHFIDEEVAIFLLREMRGDGGVEAGAEEQRVELRARRLATRAHREEVGHIHARAERDRQRDARARYRRRDARAVLLVAHEHIAVAREQHVDPRVRLRARTNTQSSNQSDSQRSIKHQKSNRIDSHVCSCLLPD